MNMVPLIERKRDGGALTDGEIRALIADYVAGAIPDYQMSALLMAIYFRGMTDRETTALTLAMAASGGRLDLSGLGRVAVDKHSTGGVGDTTTLIAAPLAAACGLAVAKMSGRGLGHTGGTLDKLESIPGFDTHLSRERFLALVAAHNLAVTGQGEDLVPADRLLYALRDVTGTVESLPLIASSVMSKKLAAGCQGIVLDVKCGEGAFMKDRAQALALGRTMVRIGLDAGRRAEAVITAMDAPLGDGIGNSLEVRDAIEVLGGKPCPLAEVSLRLTAHMLRVGGLVDSLEQGEALARQKLDSGEGADKLREMIAAQGGDPQVVAHPDRLPVGALTQPVRAAEAGFVTRVHALAAGHTSGALGAGRARKEDAVDPGAGLWIQAREGDAVQAGQTLAVLYASDPARLRAGLDMAQGIFEIGGQAPAPRELILGVVDAANADR
ncbi:MAG: thymidine phosphorylase [Christensenellales bacterium]|jgi:pyrimidine-nucleoside phosphorylase